MLTYEITPENELVITHYHLGIEIDQEEVVAGRERFQIEEPLAASIRRRLLRVRPSSLEGAEYEIWPLGCEYQLHAHVEVSVAFATPEDDVGVFVLPRQCQGPVVNEARELIRNVLSELPQSEVVRNFPPSDD
ncbi:hypothetical protein [Parasphingopyxis sp.]|uniref:hypothetical protein n=1 Tax=Parasphingopyxis sp. TaxID=1920299 RepID=UPI0032EDC2F1